MTRYRLKQDLPGIQHGTILRVKSSHNRPDSHVVENHYKIYEFEQEEIDDRPDWFEKVEERSDVEVVCAWFRGHVSQLHDLHIKEARALVDYGLDVDRIRKETS